MKHILLTKFAVKFAADNPRTRFEANDSWIDERMNLFQKYCLPSVKAQTFKDFDWWIIASPNFRNFDKVQNELEKYGKILWTDAPWRDGLSEVGPLLETYYKDVGWICTTRLDSDDIISNDFMLNIHEGATEKEAWLSFYLGYYLYGESVSLARVNPNQFISYVEN